MVINLKLHAGKLASEYIKKFVDNRQKIISKLCGIFGCVSINSDKLDKDSIIRVTNV